MAKAKKFGALSGVFTPSILTILGVIMYLRLPWIVGQAGLWSTIGIILVAHIISFTTSLSVSSIATDKKVETGGSYYIISRTLGLPIGGTLGFALFVGLSFSVSLYLIGFAEVFLGYFGFELTLNNIRIAGASILLLLTILTFISTSLAIKSQYLILTALALSLVSVFFGRHELVPSEPLFGTMSGSLPWIALFAIFFPAVTGFEAGVSMSGDLRDPRSTIPRGTISAVLVGLAVYLGLAFFFAYTVDRDILVNDTSVLLQISWVPQLVVAGILGATLSSALGSILGAPRIMQAIAMDRIMPKVLSKGYGPSNEPRNALIFTFIIALSGILIGELNAIARIVTIFFIITYGFLNITYAIESWAGTDFRPSFKIPRIISIIGALACIVVMIQLDILAMIGASLVLMLIFLYLKKKELSLQTGDAWNGVWSSLVKAGLRKLAITNLSPRNWRPNVILFNGGVDTRPHLLEMGRNLVGKLGIFTSFELIETNDPNDLISRRDRVIANQLAEAKGIIVRRHTCSNIYEGITTIARVYGFSGFEPNTILMGWGKNTRNPEAFLGVLNHLALLDYNIALLNHNTSKGFGNRKSIDIWWSGGGRNLSLALTLIRFITSAFEWRTARIRLLAVSPSVKLTEKYQELLQQMLDNYRIQAEVKVINNSAEQLPEWQIMQNESAQTDLVILNLPELNDTCLNDTNQLVERLPSSLIIRASSTFDEVAVLDQKSTEQEVSNETDIKPRFEIATALKLSEKEIVANEIYNTALAYQEITQKLYEKGFQPFSEKSVQGTKDLQPLVEKCFADLESAASMQQSEDASDELLRITNDLSFHAQRIIYQYADETIASQTKVLADSINKYLTELESKLEALPQSLRMKYHWRDFKRLRATSFSTAIFKIWRVAVARITGKPATYIVNVTRPARYFLFHKRMVLLEKLLKELTAHSLGSAVRVRRILADLYELTERIRRMVSSGEGTPNSLAQEKERILGTVKALLSSEQNFFYTQGNRLSESLAKDLQSFNNLLERPGSNFISRPFARACRNDHKLQERLEEFTPVWKNNLELFLRKVYLDLLFISYRHRIEAKVRKYHFDFNTLLATSIGNSMKALTVTLKNIQDTKPTGEKPTQKAFSPISVDGFYSKLFDEIEELIAELPSSISIAAQALPDDPYDTAFEELAEHEVNIRRIAGYSIATDLIDFAKDQCLQATSRINRVLNNIQDMVRLINFNLFEDTDDDSQNLYQRTELAEDFAGKLAQEEVTIRSINNSIQKAFNDGVCNAFAPLTAATIVRSSGVLKKKVRDAGNRRLFNLFKKWGSNLSKRIHTKLVDILYSKSESQLWVGSLKQPNNRVELPNERVFSYLDSYAPNESIIKRLPFYYSKLFLGQSAIGEDFWVGMERELEQTNTAIARFKSGRAGCLIITGERNSGKSTLSRYAAHANFSPDKIHSIRAPRGATANPELLGQAITASVGLQQTDPIQSADTLDGQVFIIHDLELWWERSANGANGIRMLMELIRTCGARTLFIININSFALDAINNLTGLTSWALSVVRCQGFDARELQEMVMLRHTAGGMKFYLGRKDQGRMSAWDFARLFNRYFDITRGNPGITLSLWLASIKKISGRTLYMQMPPLPDTSFLDMITHRQMMCLLQFVLHLRCSIPTMAAILQADTDSTTLLIQNLNQTGILREKFPDVYTIDSAIHVPLVERMIKLKML